MYKAIEASDKRMRRERELRTQAMREYTGRYWQEDDEKKRPMNLVYRACRVFQAHIAYRNPKFSIDTDDGTVRGEALVLAALLNNLAMELDFSGIDRMLLLDAMLGPRAIVRMGMKAGADVVTQEGRDLNPGQWYLRRISLDDHLVDPRAKRRYEMAWEGDRYRVSKDALLDAGIFDNSIIERLPTMPTRSPTGADRADDLSGKRSENDYELIDTVELVDLFFYDTGGSGRTLKMTLPTEREADTYLREEEFEGPERGPYEWMEFDPIPDNLSALAPVASFREQSENVNNVLAKALEQIGMSKRIGVVDEEAPEDEVDAIKDANDGKIVRSRGAKLTVADFSFVSPELIPMGKMLAQFANVQAGNPDVLGGSSESDTATEYAGNMATANVLTDMLVDIHDGLWTRVGRHALWYLTHDPLIQRGTSIRIPGGEKIPVRYSAQDREGSFEDFRLKVVPRSSVRVDDNLKARRITEMAAQVPALVQTEAMTGGGFSAFGTIKVLGRTVGIDELDEMFPDPGLIQQTLMKYAALGPPTQGVPQRPGAVTSNQQTTPIAAVRSAAAAGVPA